MPVISVLPPESWQVVREAQCLWNPAKWGGLSWQIDLHLRGTFPSSKSAVGFISLRVIELVYCTVPCWIATQSAVVSLGSDWIWFPVLSNLTSAVVRCFSCKPLTVNIWMESDWVFVVTWEKIKKCQVFVSLSGDSCEFKGVVLHQLWLFSKF